jgi:hypothetical protein
LSFSKSKKNGFIEGSITNGDSMKTLLTTLIALSTLSAVAGEITLHCQGTRNYEVVMEQEVKLADLQKNLSVGQVGEYEVIVSSLGNNKIELQGYDSTAPSRTYSTTVINKSGDTMELAIWTREFIFEVKCSAKI